MNTNISWAQGDYNVPLSFTLENNDGTAFNLLGYTLTFKSQFAQTAGIKFTAAMAIDNSAAGVCHYTPSASDFNQAGVYNCQIVAVTGSTQITWTNIVVKVTASVPTY